MIFSVKKGRKRLLFFSFLFRYFLFLFLKKKGKIVFFFCLQLKKKKILKAKLIVPMEQSTANKPARDEKKKKLGIRIFYLKKKRSPLRAAWLRVCCDRFAQGEAIIIVGVWGTARYPHHEPFSSLLYLLVYLFALRSYRTKQKRINILFIRLLFFMKLKQKKKTKKN